MTKFQKIQKVLGIIPFYLTIFIAIVTYIGCSNVLGGVIPRITSRIIPPPIAVTQPSTQTPSISMRCFRAVRAPDIAKAIVPIISKNKKIISYIKNPPVKR